MVFRCLWEILKYNGDRYLFVYQLFLHYVFIFRPKVNFFHLYILTSESPRCKDTYIFTTTQGDGRMEKNPYDPGLPTLNDFPTLETASLCQLSGKLVKQGLSEIRKLQNTVIFAREVWVMGLHLHSIHWLLNYQYHVGLPSPSFSSKVTRSMGTETKSQ